MLQVCSVRYWYLARVLKRCYGYSLSSSGLATWYVHHCLLLSPSCLSWCFCHEEWCKPIGLCVSCKFLSVLQMECTQERVLIFIKGYNRSRLTDWGKWEWCTGIGIHEYFEQKYVQMYLGHAYVVSWGETIECYTFLETLITCEWKTIK
jgi:hypothetical protein